MKTLKTNPATVSENAETTTALPCVATQTHQPADRPPPAKQHRKRKPKSEKGAATGMSPEDRDNLIKIKEELDSSNAHLWKIGDDVLSLTSRAENPVRLKHITQFVGGRHATTLSRAATAARALPPDQRNPKISVYDAYSMTLVMKAIPGWTLPTMIDAWLKKEGAGQRKIRDFFFGLEKSKRASEQAAIMKTLAVAGTSDDRTVWGFWEEHLDPAIRGLVKVIFADPPYGQYNRGNGGYNTGTTPLRTASANDNRDCALRTTLAVFETAEKWLALDGIIILFQAGTLIDRHEVAVLAAKKGLVCTNALTWLKGSSSPRDFDGPYGSGTERILIFHREGQRLPDCSAPALPRGDVLYCPSPSQKFNIEFKKKVVEIGDGHAYQKPLALYEYLLIKHTQPRDLILDLFGCTAATCVAAIKRGRDWRYYEALEENYNEGVRRIQTALEGRFEDLYDLPARLLDYEFPEPVVDVINALRKYDEESEKLRCQPETAYPANSDPMALNPMGVAA